MTIFCIFLASVFYAIQCLEHSKSYLVDETSSFIHSYAFDQDFLYIPSSNDVVQRSIETGQVVRTLRGHSARVQGVVLLNETLISGANDGSIVLWNLTDGAILRRLDSKCSLSALALYKRNILISCLTTNSLMIDLETGNVVTQLEVAQYFYVYGNIFYGFYTMSGLFKYAEDFSKTMIYHDFVTYAVRFNNTLIFAEGLSFKLNAYNELSGQLLTFSGSGHTDLINTLYCHGSLLLSSGNDYLMILWDINSRSQIRVILKSDEIIYNIFPYNGSVLLFSDYHDVIMFDTLSNKILKIYAGQQVYLTSLAVIQDILFSGGIKVFVKEWSISKSEYISSITNNSYTSSLFVVNDMLLTCYDSIAIRDIYQKTTISEFANGMVDCHSTFFYFGGFVYAPSADFKVLKFNLSSSEMVLQFFDQSVTSSAGNMIVIGSYLFVSYYQSEILQWNTGNGNLFTSYDSYRFSYFSTLGPYTLFSKSTVINKIDLQTGLFSLFYEANYFVDALYYLESYNTLFVGGNTAVYGLDTRNNQISYKFIGHSNSIYDIISSGDFLFSCGEDGSIKQWSLITKRLVFSFEDRSLSVRSLISFDDNILIGVKSGGIYSFKISNCAFTRFIPIAQLPVTDMILDQNSLFISSAAEMITLLNVTSGVVIYELKTFSIPNTLYLYNGYLFSGNDNQVIVQWNFTFGEVVKSYLGHRAVINDIIFYRDILFSAGSDSNICRWNLYLGSIDLTYKGHSDEVTSLFIYKSILYSGSQDKTILKWGIEDAVILMTLKRTSSIPGHLGPINKIQICNGDLFSASSDLTIKQWNIDTGGVKDTLFGHTKSVNALYCYKNLLFSGGEDFSTFLWYPEFPLIVPTTFSSLIHIKQSSKEVSSDQVSSSNRSSYIIPLLAAMAIFLLFIAGFVTLYCFVYRDKIVISESAATSNPTHSSVNHEYSTMFTHALGLALPGYLELDSPSIDVKGQIEVGGTAAVFLCQLKDKNKKYVAKVFSHSFDSMNAKQKLSYDQEITIMDYLQSNKHMAKIVGYCRKPCCIVMKYYEKGSLSTFIHHSTVYTKKIVPRFLQNIANGLQFMHEKRLAHCDLKPQNILLDSDKDGLFLVLTDFGITVVLDQSIIDAQAFNVVDLKGLSVHYAAPEAFLRFQKSFYLEPKTMTAGDVYSFGVISFELLSRKVPWKNN